MYITTFYSFKGGVGRTMALVNAAVSLALNGRRVLVVDFDIEAPGLDTFDVLRPRVDVPGITDFVAQYLESGQAPDVAGYIGECPDVGKKDGKLWIMPSGKRDTYAATLGQIDWIDLYGLHDGFLLIEDLKQQWKQLIRPDYVLIDSRTGHSDSSGICTRQLPDAVVILFFPNEQNLRGLTKIVSDIRSEADEPRRKNIALHFVMSNVPDLDDEDLILREKMSEFRDQLGFRHDPIVVHRYDSLSLLNQAVFSRDRPRSRLARQYNEIVREITTRNWNDRDGALEYIQRSSDRRRWLGEDSIATRDWRLDKIEKAHKNDGEILFRLAEFRESILEHDSAALLVNQSIEHGFDQPEAFLKRSRILEDNEEPEGAVEDSWRVLGAEDVAPTMILEAVGRLTRLNGPEPHQVVMSKSVKSLGMNQTLWLAVAFNRSRDELTMATCLLEPIIASSETQQDLRWAAERRLALPYLGLGRFGEAAELILGSNSSVSNLGVADAFNYGMALWGVRGILVTECFERVVELDQAEERPDKGANYFQCMALAYWAVGRSDQAVVYADLALGALRSATVFSCWRYLEVNRSEFRSDLDEMRAMIENGEHRTPRFMAEQNSTSLDT